MKRHQRLSPLDASFLHFERGPAHMHVGFCLIFEGKPPSYDELVRHVQSRIDQVPRYRQKLAFIPLQQGRPVWIDDPHFNINYHIRHVALPKPGSTQQLKNEAGQIYSESLDRSKPLWEMYLIEGLSSRRFALVGKTHHCLVDGISGVDITSVLFDITKQYQLPTTEPAPWIPEPEPSGPELLIQSLIERAGTPLQVAKRLGQLTTEPRQLLSTVTKHVGGIGQLAAAGLSRSSDSPINVDIGPHRRFEWSSYELKQLKEIKDGLGGTVNDVVLTVVTGGLREFLRHRGINVEELSLKALVPVSIRNAKADSVGNQITATIVPLPLQEPDPIKRLNALSQSMQEIKDSGQAVGAKTLTELSGFAPPTIAAQASRLQASQRFFNLLISNVPGPQFPLYLMGRKMVGIFPQVPLSEGQAIGIAAVSYDGTVNFGITADFDSVADVDVLNRELKNALKQLHRLTTQAGTKTKATASPEPARESDASWIPKSSVRTRSDKRKPRQPSAN